MESTYTKIQKLSAGMLKSRTNEQLIEDYRESIKEGGCVVSSSLIIDELIERHGEDKFWNEISDTL